MPFVAPHFAAQNAPLPDLRWRVYSTGAPPVRQVDGDAIRPGPCGRHREPHQRDHADPAPTHSAGHRPDRPRSRDISADDRSKGGGS
nr:hypothetical protein [Nitrosomonas nitrosa]